jgi:hypothetical protein
MGAAGITRVLGRRRHPVVTRPPVLGVVRHAGLRAIRRAVGTPERRAHDRATFRKPLPNRCFCECRRQPWRRLAHATTPQRTVNGESDDFSSRSIPAHRTGTRRGRRSLWGAGMPRSREPCCSCGRRSLWGAGMPRSRETVALVRPSLPLGRRHASFAQTVLACSETGASVTPWSLRTAARQLSSQAAELALRGMPRPPFPRRPHGEY